MNDTVLSFRDVTVRYHRDAEAVLHQLSFDVARGERVALLGLNGSGKTSVLAAAVGLVPHEGEIVACHLPVQGKNLPEIRSRVGFLFNVPEDQLLFPTVGEDVAFGVMNRGVSREASRQKTVEILTHFGLERLTDCPVYRLSHGQKQRTALAGVLISGPSLLLLDEPSSGLDPPARRDLVSLLRATEAGMLVATHDLEFAAELCSRWILLEEGCLAGEGSDYRDIRQRWGV